MGRANPTVLFGFFVAVIATICGASLLKGGFYLGKHEGDTFHLLQIVFRMVEGQRPHLDFMTPIGAMAFAPIALLVKQGLGVGMAILWSQLIVSILFLPAVWWVAYSRMKGGVAYLFGFFVLVLIGALVHGEAEPSVSISMHYNRWAWAAAFVAIAAALLPTTKSPMQGIDGVIIGLMVAVMALTKITYFAAFLVPIVAGLLINKSYRTLGYAIFWGLLVVVLVTLWGGVGFWAAYLSDVLRVATSEIRPNPGNDFATVVASPAYLGASLVMIASVIFLRDAGQKNGGLLLLLLTPGFFFVTYQNFGNDPQWLQLLVVLLLSFHIGPGVRNSRGWDMARTVKMAAVVAMAMTIPSVFNLTYSPFRHLSSDTTVYGQLLPGSQRHNDIFGTNQRLTRTDARIPVPGEVAHLFKYADLAERPALTVYKGETFPDCQLQIGFSAWFQNIADDLENAGLSNGKSMFVADLFASYWMFGSLEPVKGAAPWYYGGLPGIENADYLMIPFCPIIPDIRDRVLNAVEEQDMQYHELRRTDLYILLERSSSGS